MNTRLRYIAVLFTVTLALVWCIPSGGQVLKGSISGTVIDPQGAVVSGAQIKAKNVETGVVASTTTDSSGLFRLNLLAAGTYTVDFAAQGFKTASTKDVVVVAGRDTGLGAIHMAIGEASTTVEVTAEAPLIEPTQSQITNTFAGTTLSTFAGIEENEGLDKLALFVPGTIASRSNNFSNTNGTGFSSNGLRGRNNDQEIDGQSNNDNSVAGPALFLTDPNFVQQYVIVTNNFGPEYGRNAGSVVNIITKSGTNAWHGSVFGAENSSYLNALTNTQKQTNKPGSPPCPTGVVICNPFTGPPRSNDEIGGGTIGGPIVKNKWFVFGGFDEEIFSGNNVFTSASITPTPAGLAHLGGCGVNANALTALTTYGPYAFGFGNPTPRNISHVTVGTCNNTTQGLANSQVEVGGVTRIVPIPSHVFNWVVRNDVTIGGDSFTARYLFNRNNNFNSNDNGAAGWFNNVPDFNQAILTSWTHNFTSRMVNEARVSFGRLGVEFGGGLNPFEPVAGQLKSALANISIQGGGLGFGPATNLPQSRLVNNWQAQDNWNYVFGRHQLKAGVNWTYQRSPNIFLPQVNGAYRFSSLNSFLTTDQPNRIIIAQGNPNLDFREYDTFVFAGDDWKISQNLTLNLGVTWTYYGQPANLFNQLTTKVESNASTALWKQTLPLSVRTNPEIPAVTNSFGPTVGFAYSPQWGGFLTGHGKTVFRGGYRMLYDPPFYNIFVNISSSAPMTFLQTLTATSTPSVTGLLMPANPTGPNVRAALASVIATNTFDPRTQNETNVSPDFGPDKVHSWSFGLERELNKSAALELRYSGNHAVNLFQTVDSNPYLGTPTPLVVNGQAVGGPGLLQAFPQFIPNASSLTPCTTTQQILIPNQAPTDIGRVNCGIGVARTRNNGGFSDYHSLQAEFRTNNLWKQLTMRTGYTWSKNLDNVSEIFATGTAGNTNFASQNPFQTGAAERSISGLNYPHVVTVLVTENLPFFKEQHGLIGHILGGWSFSADYIYGTGQPYTPVEGLFEATNSALGNYYDSGFVGAFLAADAARPFYGNRSAPQNSVGVFAGDACLAATGINAPAACGLVATQLISFNALNQCAVPPCSVLSNKANIVPVTTNDVRFIINARTAQSVFGTPFGNVPRNSLRDAPQNVVNASVFKNIKLGEHTSFEMRLTANNALNHFNFRDIDPNLEDAGLTNFNQGFANPALTVTTQPLNGYRIVWVGGRFFF
jgi:hypothetical protein